MPIEPGIPLTKDEVFKRITEEQIFEKYLGILPEEGVDYVNPLRVDNSPGCRFYRNNAGRLRFKDFSKGYNWDCFSVVQFIYNCTFIDAVKIIIKDFNLNKEVPKYEINQEFQLKTRYNIKISVREWNQEDLFYWNQYGITGELLFDIHPCKAIWINNDYYRCRSNDPCYCYYFGSDLYKLYFPKRTKHRFFTNIILEDYLLQGYSELPEHCDIIVITKSYKDVKSLKRLNVYAVAPQSESQILTQEQYEDLRSKSNYLFSLGDNDSAGRLFMLSHYKKFRIPYFVFPWTMEKDFSDNYKKYGLEYMENVINIIRNNEGI